MDYNLKEVAGRIKELRIHLNMNQADFGKKIGVSNTAVSKWEKAERNITDQVISSICNVYDVRREWLEHGIEPMFTELTGEEEFSNILAEIQFSDDEFIRSVIKAYWKMSPEHKAVVRSMFTIENGAKK